MKFRNFFFGVMAILLLPSCHQEKQPDETEIIRIAKEAYIYGYPVVGLYRDMYVRAIDRESPRFLKPFNELAWRSLYDPVALRTKQTAGDRDDWSRQEAEIPQTDDNRSPRPGMAYGSVWFDLRNEPCILVVPPTLAGRYFSIQFVDLFSNTFDYISNRKDGNKGGHYLIAASEWNGRMPAGISHTVRSPSSYIMGLFRIRIETAGDFKNVEKLITQFRIIPLSHYAGGATAPEIPLVRYPEFTEEKAETPEFFNYLNFMLQFCAIPEDESDILKRFGKIGIEPGKPFDYSVLSETKKKALIEGMAAGQAELEALGRFYSGKLLPDGMVEKTQKNYPYRAYMTDRYLFGSSPEEILTVVYETDANRKKLDGKKRYEMRFERKQLPPVGAFWTVTAYSSEKKPSFKQNSAYILNSALQILELNEDGSLVVSIRPEMQESGKGTNWLSVPSGSFFLLLQLYQPGEEALRGGWSPPKVRILDNTEFENTAL